MTPEIPHMTVPLTSLTNSTERELSVTPIISAHVSWIIGYVSYVLSILLGVVGIFTNTVNISVYWKMGLSETTNISFFALSIFDLLISLCTVMVKITFNPPVSVMRLPSGAPISELGMGANFMLYACLTCSAWMTAVLSVERCICISMPLKVKEIVTPKRTTFAIVTMVVYQLVFTSFLFLYPGPPYTVVSLRRSLYLNCSFSFPCLILFFVVLVSTTILVDRLKENLEWREKTAKRSNKTSGGSKGMKAARSVAAICTIFIICFKPNTLLHVLSLVFNNFGIYDPYLGSLKRNLYRFGGLLQVLSSAVNIVVYYRISTKYREDFNALFCGQRVEKS
ncbi:hypothetical protein RRG08_008972 [Elysia crispata]|uniref:G-protein coupled receptors family 1 profile domain-containing protein n=1 Tax=Elysia crispata TaxID=231223 RepID=A0AAE1AHH0_9GAST|nr:hypothetical protein RRG08_008972 [Elysia crispata]